MQGAYWDPIPIKLQKIKSIKFENCSGCSPNIRHRRDLSCATGGHRFCNVLCMGAGYANGSCAWDMQAGSYDCECSRERRGVRYLILASGNFWGIYTSWLFLPICAYRPDSIYLSVPTCCTLSTYLDLPGRLDLPICTYLPDSIYQTVTTCRTLSTNLYLPARLYLPICNRLPDSIYQSVTVCRTLSTIL